MLAAEGRFPGAGVWRLCKRHQSVQFMSLLPNKAVRRKLRGGCSPGAKVTPRAVTPACS